MSDSSSHGNMIKKLGSLIKDIPVAMLTTTEPDGTLRSRPMVTQKAEFDGTLWFFTVADAPKVDEIVGEHQVNVTYADTHKHRYVSISGTAVLVRDLSKNRELWNSAFREWFPLGPEDPALALLRMDVRKAEYWDSPSSKVGALFHFVKAVAGVQPHPATDHQKMTIP